MSLRLAGDNDRPPRQRAALSAWQRMQVEEARQLADDLAAVEPFALAGPGGAYWAGRMEGAARNLLDVIDAVAEP